MSMPRCHPVRRRPKVELTDAVASGDAAECVARPHLVTLLGPGHPRVDGQRPAFEEDKHPGEEKARPTGVSPPANTHGSNSV